MIVTERTLSDMSTYTKDDKTDFIKARMAYLESLYRRALVIAQIGQYSDKDMDDLGKARLIYVNYISQLLMCDHELLHQYLDSIA